MKKQIQQPTPVQRIVCPKCGELMLKIYPWSTMQIRPGSQIMPCKKCQNGSLKSGVAQ